MGGVDGLRASPTPDVPIEDEDDDEDEDDLLTRQILDYGAGSDSVTLEPTLIDQQCVGHGVGKARDRRLVIRLHRANLDDFAVCLDKGDRKRDRGILHPERNSLRRLKDKKHAGVFSKRLPEPQTFRLFRSSFG